MKLVTEDGSPVVLDKPREEKPLLDPKTVEGFLHVKASSLNQLAGMLNLVRDNGAKEVKVLHLFPMLSPVGGMHFETLIEVNPVSITSVRAFTAADLQPVTEPNPVGQGLEQ